MIVSHKHIFIFIKTHKTATQTFLKFIKPHLGPDDVMAGDPELINKEGELINADTKVNVDKVFEATGKCAQEYQEIYGNHLPWFVIKEIVGEEYWNSYTKFTIERSPKDRLMSLFYFVNPVLTTITSQMCPDFQKEVSEKVREAPRLEKEGKLKEAKELYQLKEKYIKSRQTILQRFPEETREYFEEWLITQLAADPQPITNIRSYGVECHEDEISSYIQTAKKFNFNRFLELMDAEILFKKGSNSYTKFPYLKNQELNNFGVFEEPFRRSRHLTGQCRFLNYGNYYDGKEMQVDHIVNFKNIGNELGNFFKKFNIKIQCNKNLFDKSTQNAHYRKNISEKKPLDWWFKGKRRQLLNKLIQKRFYNNSNGEKSINLQPFNIK